MDSVAAQIDVETPKELSFTDATSTAWLVVHRVGVELGILGESSRDVWRS